MNPVPTHLYLSTYLSLLSYMFCASDGELYSATVGDFSAGDALIYRHPMRTEQHDSQWLNGE